MPSDVRRLLFVGAWLAGGTGCAYGVLRYLWPREDPFAVVNHPWQGPLQHLHVLTVPLLVFALGAVWVAHIRNAAERNDRGQASGVATCWLAVAMVASGVLIQLLGHPGARAAAGWVHAATSVAWLMTLVLHLRWRGRTPP